MSTTSHSQTPGAANATVHRRELLLFMPSVAIASAMALGSVSSRPPTSNWATGRESVLALWEHRETTSSPSVVKPSSAERIDALVSGHNVGLISASGSDLTLEENQRRCSGLWSELQHRYGSIDVDVRFREKRGELQAQTLTERVHLLLGNEGFDSGNLKGFLRQYGAIYDQRLVLYRPQDSKHAYLLGTRDGAVPRKKQIVCVREFSAARLPDYFRLIREQMNDIDVESMRFPIRKTFFNRSGGES